MLKGIGLTNEIKSNLIKLSKVDLKYNNQNCFTRTLQFSDSSSKENYKAKLKKSGTGASISASFEGFGVKAEGGFDSEFQEQNQNTSLEALKTN